MKTKHIMALGLLERLFTGERRDRISQRGKRNPRADGIRSASGGKRGRPAGDFFFGWCKSALSHGNTTAHGSAAGNG